MNETDYIRQQLAAERSHLREILAAVHRQVAPGSASARPVAAYVDWAGRRLVQQLTAHQAGLEALATGPVGADLARMSSALARVGPAQRAAELAELIDTWTEPLDAWAASALRIHHWRRAAGLNADSILEERQLYAAARTALGVR